MQTAYSPSRIYAIALLLIGALWLQPSDAQAFDLEGATIKMELELPDSSGDFALTTDLVRIKEYFGLAHCLCPDVEFGVKFSLENAPSSFAESEKVDIWLGKSCDAAPADILIRNDNCESPKTFDDIEDLISPRRDTYPVHTLLAPNSPICAFDTGTQSVFAIIDQGTDGVEVGDNQDYVAPTLDIPYDTDPPPFPLNIRPTGAEEAIQINWELPTDSEEIRYFQVLCARADGSINEDDGFPGGLKPEYLTTRDVCGTEADGVYPQTVAGEVLPDLPTSLNNLSAATLCAETTGAQTGVRIEGLTNEVPYRLVLLTVDDYRNVTAIDLGEHTPQPVEDAWEHYNRAGGHADGGYCFVATATYGNYDHPFVRILRNFRDDTLAHSSWGRGFIAWYYDHSPALAAFISRHESARVLSYVLLAPLVAAAAVWEYTGPLGKLVLLLGFVMWRRGRKRKHGIQPQASGASARPRRALLVGVGALLLLALSATAHAQPYWDELNEEVVADDPVSHWNFEVKVGLYLPDVDSEFNLASGTKGPFEETFGSSANLMTVLVLDRYFAFPSGQLGVSGSLGFNKQYANAFELDAAGNTIVGADGKPQRSSGDRTKFRLFPTSIGAVYRFTRLDDDYNIPIIPYGRASLSYYLWYFSDPSGEVSEAPTPSCMTPGDPASMCSGDKARGGSLGYQGSLGIAVRAERLDPTAEVALRTQMGIEHAGFFAEIQLAKVDGFGSDKKLSVGDTTWFGGINFEF
jgi:hypothetical protein